MVTRMRENEIRTNNKSRVLANRRDKQRANMEYLRKNYEELLRKYPNYWVVIKNGKIVSKEKNPNRLIGKLTRTRTGDKVIYFLASPKKRMLL
jgi:thymidylate kinase